MIEVVDLQKRFVLSRKQKRTQLQAGKTVSEFAVDKISFVCQPGRIFTLLGPNGAGKTTTLRMIATMLKPSAGHITVAGFDTVSQSQQVRAHIGFLTGSTALYGRLTPREIIRYYGELHGMSLERIEARQKIYFDLFNIWDFADKRVDKLSTGMKQKVSIVRTIIHDPAVVIFDEPTTGLDVITARHIIELIRTCKKEGKTVIFSTHIMGEVSLLADDLAIIHQGRLCYNGSFDDFKSRNQGVSLEDAFINTVNAEVAL
jgi:sodium transport system ATP-binding protein